MKEANQREREESEILEGEDEENLSASKSASLKK